MGLAFSLVPEAAPADEITANEQGADAGEKERLNEGILPISVDSRASEGLRKRFKGASQGSLGKLKMLDLSLWTLKSGDAPDVLNSCTGKLQSDEGMADLTLSILMKDRWLDRLAEALSLTRKSIEGLEIIGVPNDPKEIRAAAQNWKSPEHQEVTI